LAFAAQQYWVFGSRGAALSLVLAGVAFLCVPVVLRVSRSVTITGHLGMAIFCIALGTISYLRGGLIPNVLMWTVVIPPTVVLFRAGSFIPGIAWAAIILFEFVLLNSLMKLGIVGTPARHGNGFAGLSALLVVTTGISIGYEIRRRRHAAERRKLEQMLLQSEKFESVGRLAAGIAHDFNNLLTVIRAHCRLLDGVAPRESPAGLDLAAIDEAASRGAHLTAQLLGFARRGIVQPETFGIHGMVLEVHRLLKRLLPANLDLVIKRDPLAWNVTADRAQMEQVLINLALNARDAMPTGGELRIETRNVELDGRSSQLADAPPGRYVVLMVSDDGSGIAPEILPRIFEPFFTTKSRSGGMGLGLASAYGIAKRAGGTLTVESKLGRGSTFRLYLPAADAALDTKQAADPEPAPPATPATILLVEDEPAVRRATSRLLVRQGYRVLVAEDGARALELGKSHSETIHLLLTDIVMPGLSGHDVARALAEDRPALRVAYLSGYSDDLDVAREVAKENARLIRKPYDADDLLRQVREMVASTS
jgi:two-component system, cell cycle sensor histidine kinase and response regulator CckA